MNPLNGLLNNDESVEYMRSIKFGRSKKLYVAKTDKKYIVIYRHRLYEEILVDDNPIPVALTGADFHEILRRGLSTFFIGMAILLTEYALKYMAEKWGVIGIEWFDFLVTLTILLPTILIVNMIRRSRSKIVFGDGKIEVDIGAGVIDDVYRLVAEFPFI